MKISSKIYYRNLELISNLSFVLTRLKRGIIETSVNFFVSILEYILLI